MVYLIDNINFIVTELSIGCILKLFAEISIALSFFIFSEISLELFVCMYGCVSIYICVCMYSSPQSRVLTHVPFHKSVCIYLPGTGADRSWQCRDITAAVSEWTEDTKGSVLSHRGGQNWKQPLFRKGFWDTGCGGWRATWGEREKGLSQGSQIKPFII